LHLGGDLFEFPPNMTRYSLVHHDVPFIFKAKVAENEITKLC